MPGFNPMSVNRGDSNVETFPHIQAAYRFPEEFLEQFEDSDALEQFHHYLDLYRISTINAFLNNAETASDSQAGAPEATLSTSTNTGNVITVFTPNNSVKPPVFKSREQTADSYLHSVELYLISQGHPNDKWLSLVPTLLSKENKLWWDLNRDVIKSWKDFKALFIKKNDTVAHRQERARILYSRQQKSTEPVDSYVYDMISLARQVNPNESLEESVRRAQNSLVPRLRIAIGNLSEFTPEFLVSQALLTLRNLRDEDRYNKVHSNLPPGTKEEQSEHEKTHKAQNNNDFTGKNKNRFSQNSFKRGGGNQNFSSQNREGVHTTASGFTNQPHSSNSTGRNSRVGYKGNRNDSNKSKNSSKTKDSIICRKCKGLGHYANECPSSEGVAMVTYHGPWLGQTDSGDSQVQQVNASTHVPNEMQVQSSQSYLNEARRT